MRIKPLWLLILILALAISACGGGPSGGRKLKPMKPPSPSKAPQGVVRLEQTRRSAHDMITKELAFEHIETLVTES